MDTETMTLAELCNAPDNPVKLEFTRLASTYTEHDRRAFGRSRIGQFNFRVTLTYQGRSFVVKNYICGEGFLEVPPAIAKVNTWKREFTAEALKNPGGFRHYTGESVSVRPFKGPEPKAADVIACLFCDASCWEDSSDLEDFAANFCGEIKTLADARKIEESYRQCGETAKQLKAFLGSDYAKFQKAASNY